MNKKVIVIYHSKDFDGLFSCEIARRYFGESADYVGWNYGEPTPVVPPGAQIYMIDVSVPELMQRSGLVWIDHHLSAMLDYGTEIAGYRVNGVAACRLAWQLFFGGHRRVDEMPNLEDFVERRVSEPWAVRLAGEYDIWDKRDPDAELFQHGLRTCDPDFQRLLNCDDSYVRQLLAGGRVLQFARTRENGSIVRGQGFDVQWEGLTFLAVNAARYNSLLFTAGLRPEHDGCLGFGWDGKKWRVSLYGVPGKPEIDFAAIAKKYGGGGHKQACGFECEVLPFGFGSGGRGK
ncbi:hypothetical protein [Geminisphaera colitermitum]|uniref:hypothetical protein n=1 Tax=Geminisphaera colitermitum TaxID=1148786 RepID=UPI000158CDB0|nr:hypothetical protein [Geminisphaera colitermitum]